MLRARHRLSGDAAVLLGFAVLTVAMTWPLAQHLDTHVIRAKWFYDSMVNLQILGSRVHYALGVSEGLKSPYDNYFVAPTQFSVANNENHYVLAMLWAPFYLATSDPLLAYNLLLLTCMSLSGFFTYLLVRHLSGSALAGILSGVGFAFSPYIFFELGRIQLVAAQFIPLFALFLHDAARTGRWRSMVGLGLTFVMQVGCCLYYAVFLALYALFVGTWLVLRHRPPMRPLLLRATLIGLLAAIPVASMLYPYFRARQDFPLTRSEQVTADYAGRLADFAQVYRDNKALTFMRNNAEGPTEPIAFPGFTLLLLATVAVIVPVVTNLRRASRQARITHLRNLVLLAVSVASAIAISYAARDLLPGLILLGIAGALWRHGTSERLAPPSTFTHLCMLVLAVVLFLGPRPFAIHGEQMRGPYQYLYQHVPGLNGIRYVSRFVVLIMLSLAVLAGYGATLLLRGGRAWRGLGFAVLLAAMLYELRNAPMALADLPHQAHLPPVYRWLSEHPGPEPIATVPAYTLGYFGARNDYAALFHHRRTIEGKSSWMPP
ncbi:MAG: hypothetical protein ACHQ53_17840, partial [Polyangiales bacterium]